MELCGRATYNGGHTPERWHSIKASERYGVCEFTFSTAGQHLGETYQGQTCSIIGQFTHKTRTGDEAKMDEMTDEEMRERVIQLAFGGDPQRFQEFCDVLRAGMPKTSGAVLRGSSITGERWNDGAPFDSDGPGTSDLDLTLVGDEVIGLFTADGFYIPMIHSKPLSDKDPDIAPDLVPLRERLQKMVGRPVNIQATRDFVRYVREELLGQPHLHLIEITDSE